MSTGTPSRGTAALPGAAHRADHGEREARWRCALRTLDVHLRDSGLETRLDGQIGAIDATLRRGGGAGGWFSRTQRAVLRPHRGRLWWWLRAPGEHPAAPFLTPLAPAAEPAAAARRILGVLAPDRSAPRP